MTCIVCKKLYTGKTVDRLRLWWKNYKESDRKFLRDEEIKQKSLHEHFLSNGYRSFEEDVNIRLTESITGWQLLKQQQPPDSTPKKRTEQ